MRLVALALVVALAGGVAAAAIAPLLDDRPAPAGDDTRRLLEAWERRLGGTFVEEGRSERRPVDDASGGLVTEYRAVQRPPDRVIVQYGAVDAWLGGRSIGCSPAPDGSGLVCADRGAAPGFADANATELARLAALVAGPSPRYTVTARGEGCFTLRLRVADPAAPLGEAAEFCFDAATGALRSAEVVGVAVVERTEVRVVRATVTEADLTLPPHRMEGAGPVGG